MFKQVKVMPDGWSEWQHPKMKDYKVKCCDCGLVHEMEFKVVKVVERKRWGWKVLESAGQDYEVEMRVRRL